MGQKQHVRRTCEQEATRPPVSVDQQFDGRKERRGALDLVDNHRARILRKTSRRIVLGGRENRRVVRGQVRRLGERLCTGLDERALARLSGTVEEDDGGIFHGFLEHGQ